MLPHCQQLALKFVIRQSVTHETDICTHKSHPNCLTRTSLLTCSLLSKLCKDHTMSMWKTKDSISLTYIANSISTPIHIVNQPNITGFRGVCLRQGPLKIKLLSSIFFVMLAYLTCCVDNPHSLPFEFRSKVIKTYGAQQQRDKCVVVQKAKWNAAGFCWANCDGWPVTNTEKACWHKAVYIKDPVWPVEST